MNILFVCTGNTCRSPAAEGIFKFLIKDDDKLKNIKAESAGLMAEIGAGASVNSVKVCMEDYGIDISSHKSRQLTENIIESFEECEKIFGSKEAVDELTAKLDEAGYSVSSGPRTTGDGYYESSIVAFEENLIEITE